MKLPAKLLSLATLLTVTVFAQGPQKIQNTGFYWPTGSSTNTSLVFSDVPTNAGTWLDPDSNRLTQDTSNVVRKGKYKAFDPNGKPIPNVYHLGYDILNPNNELGHPVYAIADGVVVAVSRSNWGSTNCSSIVSITGYIPGNCSNIAVIVQHKTTNGVFYALYGHLINVNYNPQTLNTTTNQIQAKQGRRPFVPGKENATTKVVIGGDVFKAGQQIGVIGDWPNGRHLHFSIYTVEPEPPYGIGRYTGASSSWPVGSISSDYDTTGFTPPTHGQKNPIQFITESTNQAYNYLGSMPVINPSGVPSIITVSPGGVVAIPSKMQSGSGFNGSGQNSVSAPVNAFDPWNLLHLFLQFFTIPKAIAANQTIATTNMVYVPSSVPTGNYPLEVQSIFQDDQGNIGASAPVSTTLQVVSPAGGTPTFAPTIDAVGTSGSMVINVNGSFNVYVTGSNIDPASVQALLTGSGCSSTCVATNIDVTGTSYVGTFVTPSQSGDYQLQLKNISTGLVSAQYTLTIYPALTVSCSPSTNSVQVNTPVTFTATASGGLTPYTYSWDSDLLNVGNPITTTYTNGGYVAAATSFVTDFLGNQALTTCGLEVQAGQPTVISFEPAITPFSGASFNGILSGTNFMEDGTLDIQFCQSPSFANCFKPSAANVSANSNTYGSTAQIFNIALSAGDWVVKVRNGTGSWSNNSSTFTVATARAPELTGNATILPDSPSVNSSATITVQAENSGLAVSGVIVDTEIYNSSGTQVCQKFFDAQNFPQDTINSYTVNWTPTALDTYTVKIGFFSAGWASQYSWNDSAITFTVIANPTIPVFSSTATVNPASPSAGQSVTTTANITNNGVSASGVIVDIETYNSAGARVNQTVFNNQTFFSGTTTVKSFSWTPATPDTYKVKVGIFSAGWASQYNWNDNAASYIVANATTPVFASTASASPSSLASGQTVTTTVRVTDSGTAVSGIIVDIETYNSAGTRVDQHFYDTQSFVQGGTNQYSFNLNPSAQDTYKVKVGIFSAGWASQYNWNDNATTYIVSGSATFGVGCSITPNPINLGQGATVNASQIGGTSPFTFIINGVNVSPNNSLAIQPAQAGTYTVNVSAKDSAGHSASGNCSVQVNGVPPSISSYAWTPSVPVSGQNFSGTVIGNAFVSGAQVFFCQNGTNICFQQPAAGVTVNGLNQITVNNVQLSSGLWQVMVTTQYGSSAHSAAFTVQ